MRKFILNFWALKVASVQIERYIKSLLSGLGKACCAVRNMKSYSNLTTLRMIYYAYFHSLMRYGVVFRGYSSEAKKIFSLQKKTVRKMMGLKHRESCRPAFIKLNILILASQYILSLMNFMINNLEQITFNSSIYKKSMRHGRNTFLSLSSNEAEGGLLHELKNF
jgi:hypothetical protein